MYAYIHKCVCACLYVNIHGTTIFKSSRTFGIYLQAIFLNLRFLMFSVPRDMVGNKDFQIFFRIFRFVYDWIEVLFVHEVVCWFFFQSLTTLIKKRQARMGYIYIYIYIHRWIEFEGTWGLKNCCPVTGSMCSTCVRVFVNTEFDVSRMDCVVSEIDWRAQWVAMVSMISLYIYLWTYIFI